MFFGEELGLGFAEAHGLAARALHLAQKVEGDADKDQHRQPADQHVEKRRPAIVGQLRRDLDALGLQLVDHAGVIGRLGREGLAADEMA